MRVDVAKILIHMGFVSDRDFIASAESRDSVAVKWLSQAPQPDARAIDAAALTMATAAQAKETKRVESDTARAEVKQAYSELQLLIEHKDPAIALLAAIVQKHILATLGR